MEFLVFRLDVIDRAEVNDHKNYFDGQGLAAVLGAAGFAAKKLQIDTFHLDMYTILTALR